MTTAAMTPKAISPAARFSRITRAAGANRPRPQPEPASRPGARVVCRRPASRTAAAHHPLIIDPVCDRPVSDESIRRSGRRLRDVRLLRSTFADVQEAVLSSIRRGSRRRNRRTVLVEDGG
jgi:hypothetical protein